MEKRVLLAISLSFVVLFVYQMLVPKPIARTLPRPTSAAGRPTAGPAPGIAQSTRPSSGPGTGAAPTSTAVEQDKPGPAAASSRPVSSGPTSSVPALNGSTSSTSPAPAATEAAARVADTVERDIVVDTTSVHAVFSNRGALLKSWTLKKYLDENGRPIDITPPVTSAPETRPFALSVADPGITTTLQTALYKPSATSLQVGDGTQTLTFDYEDANGLVVKKAFEFQPQFGGPPNGQPQIGQQTPGKPYVVQLTVSVTKDGQAQPVTVHGGAGLGDLERAVKPGGFFRPSNYQQPEAIYQIGIGKTPTRVPYTKLAQQPVQDGPYRYVGVDDHYFIGVLLQDDQPQPTRVEYATLEIPEPSTKPGSGARDLVDYRVQVNGGSSNIYRFFYGPKDFDLLKSTDGELVRAINFGTYSQYLAVPLLRALKSINAYVGNYGWSIILLTIGINLVLFPLRHKSVVSMRRMQEIQPQVKAIQDRYAKLKVTDPARQKMNTELMTLYKEKGVNPASGCVPMVLTLPVLFAFYSLLSVAIELRGAPFMLWIHDLSRYDPYFVTPILMGITQFLQTRMTPATGDPAQQRMMMLMPLMFMVFFVWAPSGLVLYWFVSNLWSIGQQYLTNQLIGPPPQHVLRPAAERRVKRVES